MTIDRPDLMPLVGQKLTVIAWLWARTVKSPNPAFSHVDVPLVSSFILSSKEGKEVYVESVIEGDSYRFTVKMGIPPESAKNGTKLARGANFCCVMSGTPIPSDFVKTEGQAERIGTRLMAIVAEGIRGRVYISPTRQHEEVSKETEPTWKPETPLPNDPRNFWTPSYGLTKFCDLFTSRQLVALTTFSNLIQEAIEKVRFDGLSAGMPDDGLGLDTGDTGATAYAQAAGVYLGLAVSKMSNRDVPKCLLVWCSILLLNNNAK